MAALGTAGALVQHPTHQHLAVQKYFLQREERQSASALRGSLHLGGDTVYLELAQMLALVLEMNWEPMFMTSSLWEHS